MIAIKLTPYLACGIVRALNQELATNRYGIPAIRELDQDERTSSWPDPMEAPARTWSVTVQHAEEGMLEE